MWKEGLGARMMILRGDYEDGDEDVHKNDYDARHKFDPRFYETYELYGFLDSFVGKALIAALRDTSLRYKKNLDAKGYVVISQGEKKKVTDMTIAPT